MKPKPSTLAKAIEQDPSLLNRKGVLEAVKLEKLAAGGCTITEVDIATGEVLSVTTQEALPGAAWVAPG